MRLENVELDQDLVGARIMRLPATVDANNTSQGMHDRILGRRDSKCQAGNVWCGAG